jgi:FkbM family methyltransferase
LAVLVKALRDVSDDFTSRVRAALRISVEQKYDGFSIFLFPKSRLPKYQREYPKYDRFLPHLAKYLDAGAAVIDVGANVGDTLAGMAEQNDRLVFLCVEADTDFFGRLVSNIARIEKARPSIKSYAIRALAGVAVTGVALVETYGATKHAVVQEGGSLTSKSLDQIVSELPATLDLRLIKSDVDGFDYDVIDSAFELLRRDKPMVFFECQTDADAQRTAYRSTIRRMAAAGYVDWTLFDNFGAVVLRTRDIDAIEQLMNYVWIQNCGQSTRTIYYYDLLAIQDRDAEFIDRVLRSY